MNRRAGSVRFDPYYKVQWWDVRSSAWRDVQKRFVDKPAARRHASTITGRTRLMEVTMDGRAPV